MIYRRLLVHTLTLGFNTKNKTLRALLHIRELYNLRSHDQLCRAKSSMQGLGEEARGYIPASPELRRINSERYR